MRCDRSKDSFVQQIESFSAFFSLSAISGVAIKINIFINLDRPLLLLGRRRFVRRNENRKRQIMDRWRALGEGRRLLRKFGHVIICQEVTRTHIGAGEEEKSKSN